jgi:hypothetical protein
MRRQPKILRLLSDPPRNMVVYPVVERGPGKFVIEVLSDDQRSWQRIDEFPTLNEANARMARWEQIAGVALREPAQLRPRMPQIRINAYRRGELTTCWYLVDFQRGGKAFQRISLSHEWCRP